jgi:hypothetical protein
MTAQRGPAFGRCTNDGSRVPLLGECTVDSCYTFRFYECLSCGTVDVFVYDRWHDWEWVGQIRGCPAEATYCRFQLTSFAL